MNFLPINRFQDVTILDFAAATVLPTVSADTICAELEVKVYETDSHRIILDFSPMIYLTSAMIGGLIKFRRYCARNGIELKLCNLSENIQSVFAITNLDTSFDCYEDCAEASQAFDEVMMSSVFDSMYAEEQLA